MHDMNMEYLFMSFMLTSVKLLHHILIRMIVFTNFKTNLMTLCLYFFAFYLI